jgi:hypothetical protein
LQQAFREAAARLAAKHGVEVPQHDEDGSEDEGESGSEDEGEDGSDNEGEDGSEGAGEGEQAAAAARGRKRGRVVVGEEGEEGLSSNDEEGESESEKEQISDDAEQQQQQQEEEEAPHPTKALKQQQRQQQQQQDKVGGKSAAAAAELDGPLDLSFTPAVPGTYQEFEALVGNRPADQLQLAIQRIRTFNAAALATDHKRKLQVGDGVLRRVRAPWMSDRVLSEPYFDGLWRMLLPSDVWGTWGCLLGGWLLLLLLLLLLLPLLGMMSHASLQTSRCTLKNTLLTVPLS